MRTLPRHERAAAMTARLGPSATELCQIGVIVASLGLGSLLPAPSALDSTARPWPTPIVVAMLGVTLIAAQRRWPRALSGRRGVAALLACALLAVAAIATYLSLLEAWTCRYYSQARIMGAQLTAFAAEYMARD